MERTLVPCRATFFLLVFVDGILILPDGFVVLLKQTGDRRRFLISQITVDKFTPVFLREGFQLY